MFVERNGAKMSEAVKAVISSEAKDIFSVKSAQARNEQFMQKNSSSLDHRVFGKAFVTSVTMENLIETPQKLDFLQNYVILYRN